MAKRYRPDPSKARESRWIEKQQTPTQDPSVVQQPLQQQQDSENDQNDQLSDPSNAPKRSERINNNSDILQRGTKDENNDVILVDVTPYEVQKYRDNGFAVSYVKSDLREDVRKPKNKIK